MAMFKGSVAEEVAADEGAFLPGLLFILVPALLKGLYNVYINQPFTLSFLAIFFPILRDFSLSLVFLFLVFVLMAQIIFIGILHLLAKLVKGKSGFMDYFQTSNIASVIAWPSSIPFISGVIIWPHPVPVVGMLFFLWYVAVMVMVTSRVHRFGIGKAIAVVSVPLVLLIAGLYSLVVTALVFIAPTN